MRSLLRRAPFYPSILVHRRAPLWKKAGLIFIHIPKNGGTSLNHAIYGQFMGHYSVRDIARARPDLLAQLPSFAVARNPWARVYSAYRFAREGQSMKDGAQIANPNKYRVPQFESFERFVIEWLDGRDLSREDFVFREQCEFVTSSDNTVGVACIGRLEDPTTYVEFVEAALGRELELPHLNRTANRNSYREVFTQSMREVVARAYRKDIELFGYDW